MTDKVSCYITGATGFVGKNLIQYLDKDLIDAIPLSVRSMIDPSFITSGSVIIHLAGKAHDAYGDLNYLQDSYDQVNYTLTQKIFDIFLSSAAAKFVFISSVKAVADFPEQIVDEDAIPNPQTAYGISKLKAEKYLLSVRLPPGKKLYILRPCMIHGPGNKGNLNLLYNFIKKGLPYPLSAFENKRSFLSIGNLCFTIQHIVLRHDIPTGLYNVADDIPISTNRLIELISLSLGKRNIKLPLNKRIVHLIAKIGDYTNLPFNTERLNKLVTNYEVSNKKIVAALGVSLPVDAEDGIEKTLLSFRG